MISAGERFYYGTRADLNPGDLIDGYLTPDLDAAIWDAELARLAQLGVEPIDD